MKSKIMVAGAIVALAAVCLLAVAAYSMASPGKSQQPTCSVSGYVVDSFGKGFPGLEVTLHVLSYDNSTMTSQELYTMTAYTNETPKTGAFVFDQVKIPEGTVFAYAETHITVNGTNFTGRTNNYTLTANTNVSVGGIVLRTQATPVMYNYEDGPKCSLVGHVYDADGNPLGGINVNLHGIGVLSRTGETHEVYNKTLTTYDDPSRAGTFTSIIYVPPEGMKNSGAFVVSYGYVDATVQQNGKILYGRSDNFTIKDNATIFANLTCVPSPAPTQ